MEKKSCTFTPSDLTNANISQDMAKKAHFTVFLEELTPERKIVLIQKKFLTLKYFKIPNSSETTTSRLLILKGSRKVNLVILKQAGVSGHFGQSFTLLS